MFELFKNFSHYLLEVPDPLRTLVLPLPKDNGDYSDQKVRDIFLKVVRYEEVVANVCDIVNKFKISNLFNIRFKN